MIKLKMLQSFFAQVWCNAAAYHPIRGKLWKTPIPAGDNLWLFLFGKMTRINLKSSLSMLNMNKFWSCLETFCVHQVHEILFPTTGGAKGFSFQLAAAVMNLVVTKCWFFFLKWGVSLLPTYVTGKVPFFVKLVCKLAHCISAQLSLSKHLNGARQQKVWRSPSCEKSLPVWFFFLINRLSSRWRDPAQHVWAHLDVQSSRHSSCYRPKFCTNV